LFDPDIPEPATLAEVEPYVRAYWAKGSPMARAHYRTVEEAIRDVTAAFLGREENPKAPWRMTRDEYLVHDRLLGYWGREIEELADRVRSHDHRVHVERALKAGKFVPPEVLADYPELRDLRAGNPGVVKRRAGGATPKPVKRSDWPIGKALDEAYKAGLHYGDTGAFWYWLGETGLAGRGPLLHARLEREFRRAVEGEPERTVSYKGAAISLLPDGEWSVSIEPESRFDGLAEAKQFVDAALRGRNPFPRAEKDRASQSDLVGVAEFYQDQFESGEPGHAKAADLRWALVDSYPVDRLYGFTPQYVSRMMDEVRSKSREFSFPKNWYKTAQTYGDPVVVFENGGRGYVWEGNHRIAVAISKGAKSIPALVGRRAGERNPLDMATVLAVGVLAGAVQGVVEPYVTRHVYGVGSGVAEAVSNPELPDWIKTGTAAMLGTTHTTKPFVSVAELRRAVAPLAHLGQWKVFEDDRWSERAGKMLPGYVGVIWKAGAEENPAKHAFVAWSYTDREIAPGTPAFGRKMTVGQATEANLDLESHGSTVRWAPLWPDQLPDWPYTMDTVLGAVGNPSTTYLGWPVVVIGSHRSWDKVKDLVGEDDLIELYTYDRQRSAGTGYAAIRPSKLSVVLGVRAVSRASFRGRVNLHPGAEHTGSDPWPLVRQVAEEYRAAGGVPPWAEYDAGGLADNPGGEYLIQVFGKGYLAGGKCVEPAKMHAPGIVDRYTNDPAKAIRVSLAQADELQRKYAGTFAAVPVEEALRAGPTRGGNPKPVAEMLASEINKALDKLDTEDSRLTHEMIAAGRGNERPSEYLQMTDPLSMRLRDNWERKKELYRERDRRYGPGAPSRLPRGFGPLRNPAKPRFIDTFMQEPIKWGGVVLPRGRAVLIVQETYSDPKQRQAVLNYQIYRLPASTEPLWSVSGQVIGEEEALRLLREENPSGRVFSGPPSFEGERFSVGSYMPSIPGRGSRYFVFDRDTRERIGKRVHVKRSDAEARAVKLNKEWAAGKIEVVAEGKSNPVLSGMQQGDGFRWEYQPNGYIAVHVDKKPDRALYSKILAFVQSRGVHAQIINKSGVRLDVVSPNPYGEPTFRKGRRMWSGQMGGHYWTKAEAVEEARKYAGEPAFDGLPRDLAEVMIWTEGGGKKETFIVVMAKDKRGSHAA